MPLDWPWLFLLLCLALLGLALVGWYPAATRVRRNNMARQRTASAGEGEAEAVLARAGYRVLERQVTGRWVLLVDMEAQAIRRVDFPAGPDPPG